MNRNAQVGATEFGAFPVQLVCPKCQEVVTRVKPCDETGYPCASLYEQIPRFPVSQKMWDDASMDKLRHLLEVARQRHWKDALKCCLPDEGATRNSLSLVRADFLHAMPWQGIRDVLDVGAGIGFMACDLARYADNVVALEAVPEQAEFIGLRAKQDGLRVYPVIGSPLEMPFSAESFDLISLHGLFECLSYWGTEYRERIWHEFLERALNLLRPGGYIYIGIESLFPLSMVLEAPSGAGLSVAGLIPKLAANRYRRTRTRLGDGVRQTSRVHRAYACTARKYGEIVRKSGFEEVRVYGVVGGCNHQAVLYDINDRKGRNTILDCIYPSQSFRGQFQRAVEGSRLFHRAATKGAVVFARKEVVGGSGIGMPWQEVLGPSRTVVQLNMGLKTFGIVLVHDRPIELLEVEKSQYPDWGQRALFGFDTLRELERRMGAVDDLEMRWPRALGKVSVSGRERRRFEYVDGRTLSALLLRPTYRESMVFPLLVRAVESYLELSQRLTDVLDRPEPESAWRGIQRKIEELEMSDAIRADVRAAIDYARAESWPLHVVHGDFTPDNVIVTNKRRFVLIDWDNVSLAYPIGADLIRFQQDAVMSASGLPEVARRKFEKRLGSVIGAALRKIGHSNSDLEYLRALYIGQQISVLGAQSLVYGPLISAYEQRSLAMDRGLLGV